MSTITLEKIDDSVVVTPDHTPWEQIQAQYPDMWVLMRDPEIVLGNLVSAVVIYAAPLREDISQFREQNPDRLMGVLSTIYTGEIGGYR